MSFKFTIRAQANEADQDYSVVLCEIADTSDGKDILDAIREAGKDPRVLNNKTRISLTGHGHGIHFHAFDYNQSIDRTIVAMVESLGLFKAIAPLPNMPTPKL